MKFRLLVLEALWPHVEGLTIPQLLASFPKEDRWLAKDALDELEAQGKVTAIGVTHIKDFGAVDFETRLVATGRIRWAI